MSLEKFDPLKKAGADISGSLARFCQNEEMYLKFLKMFSANEEMPLLQIALKEENLQDIITYAHTLKGVSGNLGLTPLFELYSSIVNSGRANDLTKIKEIEPQLTARYKEFDKILKQL
ncbi:MAG: Hpt domain-containing protein [Fibrobacteraceae bacterium]|nr:Hpt domain-containing protein [Fibrobacteraceae bacterium]